MTFNFIKSNWFSIALVGLVLVAIIRNSGGLTLRNYDVTLNGQSTGLSNGITTQTPLGIAAEPPLRSALPVEVDQASASAFLKRFAAVAVSERKKFGVPASVMLAAAFLNSHIGLNESCTEANNYFALTCSKDWEGETSSVGDQCLRKYDTPWESWRDFSIYLSSQEWFGSVKQSASKDWQKWCKGLDGKKVSKISNFGEKMAEVIVYYRLFELDQS